MIRCFSKPSSIIFDGFVGSGTTLEVAQDLGRRWIGCDINKGAIQTTSKRLQRIISKQKVVTENTSKQTRVIDFETEEVSKCMTFGHYKVNNYDLQILQAEAIGLVISYLGIEKNKTDNFFDGLIGKNLVK